MTLDYNGPLYAKVGRRYVQLKVNTDTISLLQAENEKFRQSLSELLALYDDFKGGEDQCFEDAYYSFYKGQYDKWERARKAIQAIDEARKEGE